MTDRSPLDAPARIGIAPAETNYAVVDGSHVAYQVIGSGPPMVLVADWFGHLDGMWDWPPYAHLLRMLATFSRLILFDKRGVGLSDPLPTLDLPGVSEWMEDVNAVMDAVGVESATLMGVGAGGPMCLSVAAASPQRVDRLVLVNSYARLLRAPDYPAGYPERLRDRVLARSYTDDTPARVLRGADDEDFVRWWQRYQRMAVSPSTAAAMREMIFEVDVRPVLASIHVPTVVLHRVDDEWVRCAHGRFLADHIEGATLVELSGGEDLFFHGDTTELIEAVSDFVAGSRVPQPATRRLVTMLFTDVVGSTELASTVGDQQWRVLLDQHDSIVHRHIERCNGRYVNGTGDGLLAIFDSPGQAIRCAASMRDALRSIGLAVRTGIHAGEVEMRGDDIGGIAVHIAARVMTLGTAHQIVVSRTIRDLVTGSGFVFEAKGSHELKGVADLWDIYEVKI